MKRQSGEPFRPLVANFVHGTPSITTAGSCSLSDEDFRARLTDTEDSTVERTTASDYRDCLKTALAFSNSLPVGDPGIICVGVFDDGRVQDGQNLEELQKNVSKELSKVYPPIYSQMRVLKQRNASNSLR